MSRKTIPHVTALALLVAVCLFVPALGDADDAPVLPPGTAVKIRMIDKLSSEQNQAGDTFRATLEEPVQVGGKNLYPKGADVIGRVAGVHASGRLSEPGELDLVLATVSSGRQATSLNVQPLVIKGESHTKSNATKIGGGAALGAVIGAIAGGGKGAAIGTAAGAAAGTGAAAATGKKPVIVESEAVLTFVTAATPADTSSLSAPAQPADAAASTPATSAPVPVEAPSAPAPSVPVQDATEHFSLRDRRIIRNCVSAHLDDLPPDARKRPESSAGELVISDDDALSTDAQRRAAPLPLICEEQLPQLPGDLERVIYQGRVILVDSKGHIIDSFYLDENQ